MNKIKTITLALLPLFCTTTKAQDKMIVHMKDGQKVSFEMSKVDHVELEGTGQSTEKPLEGVGGTVASTVDLGTSKTWATHNVGASQMSQSGGHFAWNNIPAAAAEWGEGWHLPTLADWKELYEKCTWEWVTVDGIGGRMVTGNNGNTVFFPATGLSIDTKTHVVGSLGIYWTATSKNDSEESDNAYGSYFDSANIYNIDFAKNNAFSVRLVKDKE